MSPPQTFPMHNQDPVYAMALPRLAKIGRNFPSPCSLKSPSNYDPVNVLAVAAVDRTVTAAGARLLALRLSRPSRNRAEIEARFDAVAFFLDASDKREFARDALADRLAVLGVAVVQHHLAARLAGLVVAGGSQLGGGRVDLGDFGLFPRALHRWGRNLRANPTPRPR